MARIAGIDLPKDKRIEIGLTYIYGIGRKSAKDILAVPVPVKFWKRLVLKKLRRLKI